MTTVEWCRDAARRISRGSGRLCTLAVQRATRAGSSCWQGITGWLGGVSGLAWAFRMALLVLAALVLRKVGISIAGALLQRAEAARWLLWPLSIAWFLAAYRFGRAGWEPATAPAEPPDEHEQPDEPAPPPATEPHLPTLGDLGESVRRIGTPHAHITALADDLGTTTDRVREALTTWGIPVEPVRMRRRGSSTGVKEDHFPAPAAPSGGVVAAGQPANNNDNNTTVTRHAGGAHITVTPARQDTRAA